uniref:VWFA domain-containing protein n=1 Tax=Desertifilum tharense IPPAS B-1220 TaxID=1781255 RepID=A0A1E5QLC5_9CYAN|nr:hypothetical protein BH720_09530 [Desertifilum tharense IPPAS B-1220]
MKLRLCALLVCGLVMMAGFARSEGVDSALQEGRVREISARNDSSRGMFGAKSEALFVVLDQSADMGVRSQTHSFGNAIAHFASLLSLTLIRS